MTLRFETAVLRKLAHLIEKKITEETEHLIRGAGDVEDYRKRCGVIKGLREALNLAADIEKELRGEP